MTSLHLRKPIVIKYQEVIQKHIMMMIIMKKKMGTVKSNEFLIMFGKRYRILYLILYIGYFV